MIDYKQKCHDIYYASDVVNKKLPSALPLPVKLDNYTGGYIWGSGNEMVADFDDGVNVGDGFRIRGWGRIQNEELMQENMQFIADAINAHAAPTGFDWLRLFGKTSEKIKIYFRGNEIQVGVPDYRDTHSQKMYGVTPNDYITFNLTTGEPTDWKSLYQIIS